MMGRKLGMGAMGVVLVGVMTTGAWAQDQEAYVVTRPGPGIHEAQPPEETSSVVRMAVQENVSDGTQAVVDRPVAQPAAAVSRALAEQPVFPYLVKLNMGLTSVYLDPARDYQHTSVGGLDENNTLVRALRLPRHYQRETGPYVVRNPLTRSTAPAEAAIKPALIIPLPSMDGPPPRGQDLMPAAPLHDRGLVGPQMARADE